MSPSKGGGESGRRDEEQALRERGAKIQPSRTPGGKIAGGKIETGQNQPGKNRPGKRGGGKIQPRNPTFIERVAAGMRAIRKKLALAAAGLRSARTQAVDPHATPIGDIFEANRAQMPRELFKKLPKDGAENHDHYLYGARKK